jgi:hypothetical protein
MNQSVRKALHAGFLLDLLFNPEVEATFFTETLVDF